MFKAIGKWASQGLGFLKGMEGLGGHAARGAIHGAAWGAGGSLVSGGNVISGAIGGAIYGAGLGAGGNYAAGRWGNRSYGLTNKGIAPFLNKASTSSHWKGAINDFSASYNRKAPFKGGARGINVQGKRVVAPKMNTNYGLEIGGSGGRISVNRLNSNSVGYASASITGLAGFAGGLMGMNGSSKSHSTLSANNWNMGTAGQGYYNGVGY